MALKQSESELEQGDEAPGFELESYQGETVALSDLDNYDGVLVAFICNHCPYVKAQVDELRKLNDEFPSIAIVGINPNAETHPGDSVEKMEDFIEENSLGSEHFYYLADTTQQVAKKYGAKCTPDPFLLDFDRKLYYHGRLNDRTKPDEEVTEREMKQVIEDMLKRRDPPQNQEPSQGCSIKWREEQ